MPLRDIHSSPQPESIFQEMADPSELPLTGRVAIVTGASRGIGAAIAAHLAALGAKVVLNYASSSAASDSLAAALNADSAAPRAVAVKADVSDAAAVKTLFDIAEQAFGGEAHVLVCCAGVIDSSFPYLSTTTEESFDQMFRVNAKGAFLCCREAAKRLAGSDGGGGRIIVVTSSMIGQLKPGFAAYAASKAAVEAMVAVLAKELAGKGITANCVAPGPTATDMFYSVRKTEAEVAKVAAECPMGRVGRPEDIANVVGFLASAGGGWINGQVIRANGGVA